MRLVVLPEKGTASNPPGGSGEDGEEWVRGEGSEEEEEHEGETQRQHII